MKAQEIYVPPADDTPERLLADIRTATESLRAERRLRIGNIVRAVDEVNGAIDAQQAKLSGAIGEIEAILSGALPAGFEPTTQLLADIEQEEEAIDAAASEKFLRKV
ncbi:MAG: hypothetical protein G01um10148_88 [Parcubacteria group bacterium Gr01-1014_8]|nr:MAG: hypothetical protein G01um10148_88 [Parcubacteria group bacterium Gr01-1014_8]